MAANLAVVEDLCEGRGQDSDHGQHHQRPFEALVQGRLFESALVCDRLKDFRVDLPAAAAQLVNELGRDCAQFQIAGIEVRGLVDHGLADDPPASVLGRLDSLDVPRTGAHGFHHADIALGNRPVDFRLIPDKELIGLPDEGRVRSLGRQDALGLSQRVRLVGFEVDDPVQTKVFGGLDKGCLQIDGVGHQRYVSERSLQRQRLTRRFPLPVYDVFSISSVLAPKDPKPIRSRIFRPIPLKRDVGFDLFVEVSHVLSR